MSVNDNTKKPQVIVRDNKGRFTGTSKTSAPKSGGADDITAKNANSGPVLPQDDLTQQVPSFSTKPPVSQGGFNKETQPNYEDIYLQEAERTREIKDQLAELEKSAEAKEIKGEIELPDIVKKAGVEEVGAETPVSDTPQIQLPMDDTTIYKIFKQLKNLHQDISSSVVWLAVWCIRKLGKMHVKLKEVHGKIVRQAS